ncbi:pyrrolo-quinoline quinone [Anaerobacillus alkaliphilus]|uniref:Pyrrolo-quinoline quinone n=1 Tax=Anaerobacillus alkaliphilus TaxID=1548597 RepID=A0A4Q0VWT3_9BACI|nr:pyrrolo-quinoline quinone [Anaerobacillus alkaliphilus]
MTLLIQGCSSVTIYNPTDVATIAREQQLIHKSKMFGDNRSIIEVVKGDLSIIDFELEVVGERDLEYTDEEAQSFPEIYTEIEGVLTFRGNHYRTSPSYGTIGSGVSYELESVWNFQTQTSPRWGGGSGWTGQPSIVKWEPEVKKIMNVFEKFKEKEEFVEVIYGSLDGSVYFFELETGEKTRDPIRIGNPIKGSVAIDPRGYPLLYVGDGIPQKSPFGQRIFSLIDSTELYFQKGEDPFAYRDWGAFDGSPLINRLTDTLVSGGENGIFYKTKLHTKFDIDKRTISVDPRPMKYRYKIQENYYQGIENSVAVYRNLAFFSDNGGSVQALDLMTMEPYFALAPIDDTDSTIVIDLEGKQPFIYTSTEVDIVGKDGNAHIRKINGLTGDVVWDVEYPAFFYDGVNGGVLATPVIIDQLVIYAVARYKQRYSGLMVALNKDTGEEVWRWEMPHYAWSSPVNVKTEEGYTYIIQADSVGNLHFIDAISGAIIHQINLGSNIESSPAVFNDMLVVGTRGGKFHGVKIHPK